MAYSKYYPEGWQDNEEGGTPINAAALNNMETGIAAAHEFMARNDNPHGVTKAQVGLGNTENTADINKNVNSAKTLTTSRTIEGVSFNGGANITHYATCSTAAATTAKTATLTGFTLAAGARITVKFTVTNTGAVGSLTLNVNSTGAKPIKYRGGNLPSAGTLAAGRVYTFMYDGTNYELVGDLDSNVTYVGTAKGDLLYFSAANTPARLGIGTNGQVLKVNSSGLPAWEADNDTTYTPASAAPLMDGTAAVGTSAKYAREDHRHPVDTSRASVADLTAQNQRITDLEAENALLRELLEGVDAPIYRNASGSPATFSDGAAANIKKLSVTLTPTQSGTPSVESPVPIEGRSSVAVTRTGKNLWKSYETGFITVGGQLNKNGANISTDYIPVVPGAALCLSASGTFHSKIIAFFDANKAFIRRETTPNNANALAAQAPENCAFVRACVNPDNSAYGASVASANAGYYQICLEISAQPTAYEAYQGQTVTVPFVDSANNDAPIAVYGGVLTLAPDACTLTVTHGCIDSYGGETVPDGWMSSAGELSTGAQVVYPLDPADCRTYQLTPAQLATLYGYNYLFSDAGTLSVTYRAVPSLAYAELESNLISAILSLGADI